MEKEFDQGGPLGRWLTWPVLALTIAAIILNSKRHHRSKNVGTEHDDANANIESGQVVAAEYPAGVYPVYNENSLEPCGLAPRQKWLVGTCSDLTVDQYCHSFYLLVEKPAHEKVVLAAKVATAKKEWASSWQIK